MKYRLARGQVIGAGTHRGGWPRVHEKLSAFHDPSASIVLDDFVDATHMYAQDRLRQCECKDNDWVGFFHHPGVVDSPLQTDNTNSLKHICAKTTFGQVAHKLRHAFAFSDEACEKLRNYVDAPVTKLWHPMGDECMRQWTHSKRLWQVGFYLRNLQAAFHVGDLSGDVFRSAPLTSWYKARDAKLAQHYGKARNRVYDIRRLADRDYDELMCSSVVLTWLYGASANNVLLECIARATPIIVNRLPAVEEYLGYNYPLLIDDLNEVEYVYNDTSKVMDAHLYLKERQKVMWSMEDLINAIRPIMGAF